MNDFLLFEAVIIFLIVWKKWTVSVDESEKNSYKISEYY